MTRFHLATACAVLALVACAADPAPADDATPHETGVEASVEQLADGSWLCLPAGVPPFQTVTYNHGGRGEAVGGDLQGTCVALADEGYLALSKQRRLTMSLEGHLDDVLDGLDQVRAHPSADPMPSRIVGFSRGAMLVLEAASLELDFHRVVSLASADGDGHIQDILANGEQIEAPVLLTGVENDAQAVIESVRSFRDSLLTSGVDLTYIEYPAWAEAVDGHEMFWEVREPYWSDVVAYLR